MTSLLHKLGREASDRRQAERPVPRLFFRIPVGLGILMVGFAVYATAFIHQTSFVVNGQRNLSLFDSAIISVALARNLLDRV